MSLMMCVVCCVFVFEFYVLCIIGGFYSIWTVRLEFGQGKFPGGTWGPIFCVMYSVPQCVHPDH